MAGPVISAQLARHAVSAIAAENRHNNMRVPPHGHLGKTFHVQRAARVQIAADGTAVETDKNRRRHSHTALRDLRGG